MNQQYELKYLNYKIKYLKLKKYHIFGGMPKCTCEIHDDDDKESHTNKNEKQSHIDKNEKQSDDKETHHDKKKKQLHGKDENTPKISRKKQKQIDKLNKEITYLEAELKAKKERVVTITK